MAQLGQSIKAAVDIAFEQLATAGTYTPVSTGFPAQVLARVDVITRQPGGGMASVTAHIYLRVSEVAEPAEGDTFLDALGASGPSGTTTICRPRAPGTRGRSMQPRANARSSSRG